MAYETAALVIMAIGTAISAVGSIQAGETQKEVGNFNARQAMTAAEEKNKAAASDAYKQSMIDEGEMAQNRVYFNTHGVRINDSSPQYALETQAGNRGVNVAAIRMRGVNEASELMQQASVQRFQGQAAQTAGYLNAGGTLLSGAGKVYGMSEKFKLGKS